ncbi:unnamed protein product [Protopolystoma xenopodis]|uniref:Uncharacterized protein n=1 Tax=Protopolystoma xenopodis TaxID=117903 RepID=A0A3S5A7Z5_9PLAT|nr:unnamed protein product [Protopolystoma xenopodis]
MSSITNSLIPSSSNLLFNRFPCIRLLSSSLHSLKIDPLIFFPGPPAYTPVEPSGVPSTLPPFSGFPPLKRSHRNLLPVGVSVRSNSSHPGSSRPRRPLLFYGLLILALLVLLVGLMLFALVLGLGRLPGLVDSTRYHLKMSERPAFTCGLQLDRESPLDGNIILYNMVAKPKFMRSYLAVARMFCGIVRHGKPTEQYKQLLSQFPVTGFLIPKKLFGK